MSLGHPGQKIAGWGGSEKTPRRAPRKITEHPGGGMLGSVIAIQKQFAVRRHAGGNGVDPISGFKVQELTDSLWYGSLPFVGQ
jgi:hypothetical protein